MFEEVSTRRKDVYWSEESHNPYLVSKMKIMKRSSYKHISMREKMDT